LSFPVPGQQFVEAQGHMIVDPMKHVSEPNLRIDAVEFGGGDEGVDGCRAAAATA
jgi:hypothetical protein